MKITYNAAKELAKSEIIRCQQHNDNLWTIKMFNEDYDEWIVVAKTNRATALRFERKFVEHRTYEIFHNLRGEREVYNNLV